MQARDLPRDAERLQFRRTQLGRSLQAARRDYESSLCQASLWHSLRQIGLGCDEIERAVLNPATLTNCVYGFPLGGMSRSAALVANSLMADGRAHGARDDRVRSMQPDAPVVTSANWRVSPPPLPWNDGRNYAAFVISTVFVAKSCSTNDIRAASGRAFGARLDRLGLKFGLFRIQLFLIGRCDFGQPFFEAVRRHANSFAQRLGRNARCGLQQIQRFRLVAQHCDGWSRDAFQLIANQTLFDF
jgi:hypothetical protein